MSGDRASSTRRKPGEKRAHFGVLAVVAALAIIVLPPLAGMLLLVLQVLGDSSYDLSRFGLADVPRAAFALIVAGSAVGYLYGFLPGVLAALAVSLLVLKGHALTLSRIVLCLAVGGVLGLALLSPVAGGTQGIALLVVMLGVASMLWFVLRKALAAAKTQTP